MGQNLFKKLETDGRIAVITSGVFLKGRCSVRSFYTNSNGFPFILFDTNTLSYGENSQMILDF